MTFSFGDLDPIGRRCPEHKGPLRKIGREIQCPTCRLLKIEKAAQTLIDNSPVGDDDKPYCSDIAQPEFKALLEALT